jgi:predicted ATPase
MDSIRIKNFRSLKDTGDINIKPLTILVGKNSAGKSSFLRTFPMFKQSIEERTKSPILLYRRNGVDFGSFKDVKSIYSNKDDKIEFSFDLKNLNIRKGSFGYPSVTGSNSIKTNIYTSLIISENKENTPILSSIQIELFNNKIELFFNNAERLFLEKTTINGTTTEFNKLFAYTGGNFLPETLIYIEKSGIVSSFLSDTIRNKLKELVKSQSRKGVNESSIDKLINSILNINTKEKIFSSIKKYKEMTTWVRNIERLSINSAYFSDLYLNIILYNLSDILNCINIELKQTFKNIKYIAPIRATAERYYRIQDLSVEEVDPYGQNLPMFLGSLSSKLMEKFQKWTNENFGFKVIIKPSDGHYSIKISHNDCGEVNISDMGFGYSQILPIITQIWHSSEYESRNNFSINEPTIIFVIEQPELHLHPEFQAKFLDIIVSVLTKTKNKKEKIKFIIETHSQTLINRLGQNIVEKFISKDDVNIVIFEKEYADRETSVKTANFDDDGFLENWPIGFFKPSSIN